jgi:hypothetical protein
MSIRTNFPECDSENFKKNGHTHNGKQKGGKLAMTTAMKLREEGEKKGEIKVLLDWIKFLLEEKFGCEGLKLMDKVKELQSVEELEDVKEVIIKAESLKDIKL